MINEIFTFHSATAQEFLMLDGKKKKVQTKESEKTVVSQTFMRHNPNDDRDDEILRDVRIQGRARRECKLMDSVYELVDELERQTSAVS